MKKTTRLSAHKDAHWAAKRWRKELLRTAIRGTGYSHDRIVLTAPEVLSFSKNSHRTLAFFREFKEAVFSDEKIQRKGRVIRKPISLELHTIRSISLPSAVILAAELHRWSLQQKTKLSVRNHRQWDTRVRGLMESLGTFELLGIEHKAVPVDPHKEVILLKLQSGVKRDGQAVDQLQSWMRSMELGFREKRYVFGALDEAIVNGFEHAYIDIGEEPRFPYAGHRWWATSCFDPITESLRFFVYDQGHGIPKTLPKQPGFWEAVTTSAMSLFGTAEDANLIESAFIVGRTRTQLDQRGKGLSKMREAIELAGDGYLRVISGRGDITLGEAKTLKKSEHSSHIGGTLVEWSIPLVALQDDEHTDD